MWSSPISSRTTRAISHFSGVVSERVAGESMTKTGKVSAFLYDGTKITDLPGKNGSATYGINNTDRFGRSNDRLVCGFATSNNGNMTGAGEHPVGVLRAFLMTPTPQ